MAADVGMAPTSKTARAIPDAGQHAVLASLAHDLRQPVFAMDALLDALAARDGLPADVVACVRQLRGLVGWMAEILGSVLLAQPAPTVAEPVERPAGQRRELPRPAGHDDGSSPVALVDLSRLAREAATTATAAFPGQVDLDAADPAPVRGDPTGLRRALANLVDNAARAAGPLGRVRIEVDRNQEGVRAVVEDDGPGFGRIQPGHRLGLAVVADAVIAAGGSVELGGSDLGGAKVTIHLPDAGARGSR